jgi:hypothetical protein
MKAMTHVTRKFSQSIPEHAQVLANHQSPTKPHVKRTPIVAAFSRCGVLALRRRPAQRFVNTTPHPTFSRQSIHMMACPCHNARLKFFDDFRELEPSRCGEDGLVVRQVLEVSRSSASRAPSKSSTLCRFSSFSKCSKSVGSQRSDANSTIKAAFEELLSREQGSVTSVTYKTFRGQPAPPPAARCLRHFRQRPFQPPSLSTAADIPKLWDYILNKLMEQPPKRVLQHMYSVQSCMDWAANLSWPTDDDADSGEVSDSSRRSHGAWKPPFISPRVLQLQKQQPPNAPRRAKRVKKAVRRSAQAAVSQSKAGAESVRGTGRRENAASAPLQPAKPSTRKKCPRIVPRIRTGALPICVQRVNQPLNVDSVIGPPRTKLSRPAPTEALVSLEATFKPPRPALTPRKAPAVTTTTSMAEAWEISVPIRAPAAAAPGRATGRANTSGT